MVNFNMGAAGLLCAVYFCFTVLFLYFLRKNRKPKTGITEAIYLFLANTLNICYSSAADVFSTIPVLMKLALL